MRFDRRSPRCYVAHLKFVLALLAAWLLRSARHKRARQGRPYVVMTGNHSLAGNLKAFYEYANRADDLPYRVYYATIDRREYNALRQTFDPDDLLLATRVSDVVKVLGASCIMASHGPGIFFLINKLCPEIHFIDVGHGIGFKAFFPKHFKLMRFYTKTFLSSPHLLETYRDEYLWRPEQLLVTGYARLDRFQRADEIAERVRRELGLNGLGKIILYAPTWRTRGDVGEIPFGLETGEFLARLNELCGRIGATTVFRLHMNSSLLEDLGGYDHIVSISQKDYPETNDLLTAVDLLISDWSTIAPDFAALDRPVIFLDTPMPPPYDQAPPTIPRGGDIVGSMEALLEAVERRLTDPRAGIDETQVRMREAFHGETLDGRATERYDRAIRRLIARPSGG